MPLTLLRDLLIENRKLWKEFTPDTKVFLVESNRQVAKELARLIKDPDTECLWFDMLTRHGGKMGGTLVDYPSLAIWEFPDEPKRRPEAFLLGVTGSDLDCVCHLSSVLGVREDE